MAQVQVLEGLLVVVGKMVDLGLCHRQEQSRGHLSELHVYPDLHHGR